MEILLLRNQNLVDADIIGDRTYNVFVRKRLVKETKSFFVQIKKARIPTGMNSHNTKPKALSIVN